MIAYVAESHGVLGLPFCRRGYERRFSRLSQERDIPVKKIYCKMII